jgi:hypothetical protein
VDRAKNKRVIDARVAVLLDEGDIEPALIVDDGVPCRGTVR